MIKDIRIEPILKWAGGKRQLLSEITGYLPKDFQQRKYYEPFLGGGAVLFHFQPQNAVVNDTNEELMNLYKIIRDSPQELIEKLEKFKNTKEDFYEIRGLDRTPDYEKLTSAEKAARIVYLNRTSFNGLYRVNSKGQYNTPYGKYKNPNFIQADRIFQIHQYLSTNQIELLNTDFEEALSGIESNSFVYFDPPYDPISDTASFTSYAQKGFDKQEQIRLRDLCLKLHEQNVKFLLSNSDTDFIREIYSDPQIFKLQRILAKRKIGASSAGRKPVYEVLITNY